MSPVTSPVTGVKKREDPRDFLPWSTILEFRKGETIYSPESASTCLYLIIAGKVKICRPAEGGRCVIVSIYQPDEFFGESSLLGPPGSEEAVALEKTKVMMWSAAEIQDRATTRPDLGSALIQIFVQRLEERVGRIASLAMDDIAHRLAQALLGLAQRFGRETDDGSVQMLPFTHSFLAQYAGTRREQVSRLMTNFRRVGLVSYSRTSIVLHQKAISEWMK